MREFMKKAGAPVILASLILFHLINNHIWLNLDNTYLILDSNEHFLFSLDIFNRIKDNLISFIANAHFPARWHGIFAGYLTAPFYFLFGTSQDSGVMINSFTFLLILILSTYGIARVIAGKKAGLLAAFTISMYPLIFNHLRIYMLDLPLTAMVALSIFLLLKTGGFSNKTFSWLFALAASAGLLTKFNYLGFIIGPLGLEIFKSIRTNQYSKKRLFPRLFFLLLIILALISWFYKIKVWYIFARFYECSWLYPSYGLSLQSLLDWLATGFRFITWCLKELVNNILSFFFFIMFLFGSAVFSRNRFSYKGILWLWIAVPILFLSLLFHYPVIDRYLMPILPAFAIITGIGLTAIKQTTGRRITISLIILFGLLQFFAISYNLSFLPRRLSPGGFSDIYLFRRDIGIPYRSDRDQFSYPENIQLPTKEILELISRDSQDLKYKPYVFFAGILPEITGSLVYLNAKNNYPFYFFGITLDSEEFYRYRGGPLISPALADYVIITGRPPSLEFVSGRLYGKIRSLQNFIRGYANRYAAIKKFALPKGDSLVLLKNTGRSKELTAGALKAFFRDGILKLSSQNLTRARPAIFGSSFKAQNKIYSSVGADWNIENTGRDEIIATAKYPDIPVTEKWHISVADNGIKLKASFTATQPIEVENGNSFFVLFDNYTGWKTEKTQGRFSRAKLAIPVNIALPKETAYVAFQGRDKNSTAVSLSFLSNNSKLIPKMNYSKSQIILRFFWENNNGPKLALSPGEQKDFQFKLNSGE